MRRSGYAVGLLLAASACYDRPPHRNYDAIGAPAVGVVPENMPDPSTPTPDQARAAARDRILVNARQKFTATGIVREAGDERITITRPKGAPLELLVQPLTSVHMAGRPMTPRSVPPGAEVRASYVVSGRETLAETIEVVNPVPMKGAVPSGRRRGR